MLNAGCGGAPHLTGRPATPHRVPAFSAHTWVPSMFAHTAMPAGGGEHCICLRGRACDGAPGPAGGGDRGGPARQHVSTDLFWLQETSCGRCL